MNESKDIKEKKRLMFIKGEDFYFLTYNILLVLDVWGCYSENRRFKDYRKLSFLIDFVSDYNLAHITSGESLTKDLKSKEKEALVRAYSNGLLRLNEVLKLLFTLEKKGLVSLQSESGYDQIDVFLHKERIPADLFEASLFKLEVNNLLLLKNKINKISSLKLESLLDRLFYKNGVSKWVEY